MTYSVYIGENNDFSFCEGDEVKSILQNLALLFNTRQGTVPMYRRFGLPMGFVDKPQTVIKPLMIAEIEDAMEEFEPRATFKDLEITSDISGKSIVKVEVEI